MEHSSHSVEPAQTGPYNVNLQTDPASPRAEESSLLTLVVTEQPAGDPLRHFDLVHDRLMHLVVVDATLHSFAHLHPQLDQGLFRTSFVFPSAGQYKLWADIKPVGSTQFLTAFRLTVAPRTEPSGPAQREDDRLYSVQLEAPSALHARQEVALKFTVRSSEGNPIEDLQPLMGAGGHCVVISSDLARFLHVHPIEEVETEWRGGPEVVFRTTFPHAGRYRAWAQFQHEDRVITEGFDLAVS